MALWRSSVRTRSAPPLYLSITNYLMKQEWKSFFPFSLLILILPSCSETNIQTKAEEILTEEETNPELEVQRSADGLQFKKTKKNTNLESSVGFTKEGQVSYKGDFKNGKAEGLWITFFPDGKPRWEGIKKNGLNDGPFTMWYENGRKKLEGFYQNGKKHGKSTAWYQNGAKWQHKFYQDGTSIGTWKKWDENGKLISELTHNQELESNATQTD